MIVFYDHQVFQLQRHGGISRYFFHLYQEFVRAGTVAPEVLFGVHQSELLPDLRPLVRQRGPAVHFPSMARTHRLRRLANQALLGRELRRSTAQVYHPTYHWTPTPKPRLPIAFTVYDLIRERFRELYGPNDAEIEWRTHSLGQADVIFTISEATRDDLLRFYPVDPAKVIVTPLANTLRGVKGRASGRTRPFLLFVGQRGGYKNFAILLAAFQQFRSLREDFDLVCFGGEPLDRAGWPEGARIEQVRGDDSDLVGLYQDAFALVYPSRMEGFGLPLLEAMFLRCPVIATRCGSLPEVGGDAALYFEPDDPSALVGAIERLKSSGTRADFIGRGQRREEQFSWQRTAELTYAGYRRITGT